MPGVHACPPAAASVSVRTTALPMWSAGAKRVLCAPDDLPGLPLSVRARDACLVRLDVHGCSTHGQARAGLAAASGAKPACRRQGSTLHTGRRSGSAISKPSPMRNRKGCLQSHTGSRCARAAAFLEGEFGRDEERHIDAYFPYSNLARALNRCRQVKGRARNPAHRRMPRNLRSPAGRAAYEKRKELAEPVFGLLKAQRGMRRFRMRGLRKRSISLLNSDLLGKRKATINPIPTACFS